MFAEYLANLMHAAAAVSLEKHNIDGCLHNCMKLRNKKNLLLKGDFYPGLHLGMQDNPLGLNP